LNVMVVLTVAGLLAAAPAAARQAPVDVDALGPQVGARVPEFSGTDQRGRTQTLESLMGREGLMLVFNRSADW
jgi:hypothetical protein